MEIINIIFKNNSKHENLVCISDYLLTEAWLRKANYINDLLINLEVSKVQNHIKFNTFATQGENKFTLLLKDSNKVSY